MSEVPQSGGHKAPHHESEPQKCFVAHSHDAEWHDTVEAVCNELLPEYGLEPWYAEYNYDPTTTLRDKIVSMIDSAPYGIYDLSYWRANEHSPWIMPCNVLIELGIAIALNRPTLLLRHTGNRVAGIALPKSIQSVTQICEFTGGDYSLENALHEHLSPQASLPKDGDWHHHRCRFGEIDCSYLQVYPHTVMIGHDKLHCHIADGPDTDQLDFRRTVENVLGRFNNISYSYLDKGGIPRGYTFLLCTHCQLIRSTPFAIYRITPDTSPDTYIAIGVSIGLEYRFRYKIPRFMITKDMQHVPSLLQGYQCVFVRNLHALKTSLPQFVQHILTKIDEPAYWRPQELPFEKCIPLGSGAAYEDTVEETSQEVEQKRKPLKLFYCYAHKDKALRDALDSHLSILKRQKDLEIWYDGNIGLGTEWEHEIDKHLLSADIILLLVSPAFLASDYCYRREMALALEKHEQGTTWVIPIILQPIDWKDAPFGKLAVLPSNGRPVTEWSNRERAFAEIVVEIRRVVEELREK
jgi:TIR domain-containing protein